LLLQNNLQELHALLSFAVGDVLGTASQFKRIYGAPGVCTYLTCRVALCIDYACQPYIKDPVGAACPLLAAAACFPIYAVGRQFVNT
jgi:hypothetical protein